MGVEGVNPGAAGLRLLEEVVRYDPTACVLVGVKLAVCNGVVLVENVDMGVAPVVNTVATGVGAAPVVIVAFVRGVEVVEIVDCRVLVETEELEGVKVRAG